MCRTLCESLCQYKSIRFIQVKDKRLACVYYTLMFIVLAYVVGYTIIAQKGYQEHDEIAGTTFTKVKGSASIGNDSDRDIAQLIPLDAMDVVRPSMEQNAVFLTTSMTTTTRQTQSICDGNPEDTPLCTAANTSNCEQEFYSWNSQGIYTGACGTNDHCSLYTWCPVENDTELDVVNNVGEFTVFVMVDVVFDRWNISITNTEDRNNDGHPIFGYNLFSINDILSEATEGVITDTRQIAEEGAVILFASAFHCDLDQSLKYCTANYDIQRIDGQTNTITNGFNYRTITYDTNKETRLLEKLHGIRIVFIVEGVGSMFNLVALSVTFGAGLAYLGIATLITDIILERFLDKSKVYYENKHREIENETEREEVYEESQALNTP